MKQPDSPTEPTNIFQHKCNAMKSQNDGWLSRAFPQARHQPLSHQGSVRHTNLCLINALDPPEISPKLMSATSPKATDERYVFQHPKFECKCSDIISDTWQLLTVTEILIFTEVFCDGGEQLAIRCANEIIFSLGKKSMIAGAHANHDVLKCRLRDGDHQGSDGHQSAVEA